MKEQLRTEAEKEIFNELSFTGLDKPFVNSEENTDDALVFLKIILKKNNVRQHLNIRDCGYSQLERDIVDGIKKFGHFESHNFHAQQSKDNTEAIDRLKSIIEACPRGSFFRLELNKVLKDLQIK